LNPPARNINLPDTANIAIVVLLTETENDSLKSLDSTMLTKIAMSLKNNLEESPKYNSYIFPVYTINTGENELTQEDIAEIKANSAADYLISVERFKARISNKLVRTISENYIHIIVPHQASIKVYDINNFSIVDNRQIKDTLFLQINLHSWETDQDAAAQIPDPKTSLQMVCTQMAKAYVEEIVPYWKEETRYYYLNPTIRNAQMYIENEEWSRAMNIWAEYVDDTDKTLAAISCFNMALGCEMIGEYELALKWMENVKRKKPEYYWEGYKARIEQRISEKTAIDKIMKQ
jgi:hypothetical protein